MKKPAEVLIFSGLFFGRQDVAMQPASSRAAHSHMEHHRTCGSGLARDER
jgi:hypothetical protein